MMKKIYFISVAVLICSTAFSKIWRVNNIAGITANFTTIQAAHDNASVLPGDTIHLEPSTTDYGSLTMTKKLTIISIGDFLASNPGVEYSLVAGTMGSLTINNATASGSTFHCNFSGNITISNTSSMRIERCHIQGNLSFNSASNNIIIQNYVYSAYFTGSNNNIFSNNIVEYYLTVYATSSATITNNVLSAQNAAYYQQIHNATFQNNIINKLSTFTFTNTVIENNIAANAELPAGSGNQNDVIMTNVFEDPTGIVDAAFKLQTLGTNPASGAGIGGTDCGAFGGTSPFKPGLQAAIPSIYKLSAPATPSGSTMNVTFSTRSNN